SHGARERVPFRVLAVQLLASLWREPIVAGAFALLGQFPRSGDPAVRLEPVQRGIERPRLDLQQVFGGPLNMFGNRVAVTRSRQQRTKDEEVERASEEFDARR